ncbi:GIY-YIG nuclease family protein [Psychrobacter sp.]|uniref:GIY-YIG nuclease family protein n=1 Tax=Psychrobacter sp. TaxID=56811 RepID=UPI003BAF98D9
MANDDGYIYILTNKFVPNIYKIGYTKRSPIERAREISRATGVAGKWEVARDWPVNEAYQTEQYIFAEFKSYRLDKRGEMFDFRGKEVEYVIKKMDNLLLKKQHKLKDYIEKLYKEKLEVQNRDRLAKEVVAEVEKALVTERLDSNYISRIRRTIDRMSREASLAEIEVVKNNSKQLEIYKYGTLAVGAILAVWFNIESFVYYALFAIVFFVLYSFTTNNEDEIKKVHHKHSWYYLENLSQDIDVLKPIMAKLKIKRVIYIEKTKVSVKADGKTIILSAIYNEKKFNQSYSGDEKSALVEFMIYLKQA